MGPAQITVSVLTGLALVLTGVMYIVTGSVPTEFWLLDTTLVGASAGVIAPTSKGTTTDDGL